jgi:Ycf66 protein N-terminus
MGFAFPAALLFGLVLILASLSLFIVSKVKPNLYEESDSIYVILGIVCGLLLLVSLELSAAMAFQQLLLLSATITLMWRFITLRAENKQLKNKQSGVERPKAYNARLEDDYLETPREQRRQGKRRRNINYDTEDSRTETLRERRLLGDSQDSTIEYTVPERRNRSFDNEDLSGDRYGKRQEPTIDRRRADWVDETDWDDSPEERLRQRPSQRTPRRALPDADGLDSRAGRTKRGDRVPDEDREPREFRERESRRRDEQFASDEPAVPPRRRPRPPQDRDRVREVEGTMASYVDYQPVVDPDDKPSEPPSGLPPSGTEPIVFPDRY